MKKVFLLTIFGCFLACLPSSTSAQTTFERLKQKVDSAPSNQWGIKRVNYGTWSSAPGKENVWAVYEAETATYTLMVAINGQSAFKEFLQFKAGSKNPAIKDAVEAICEKLDPTKWTPSLN